MRLGRFAVLLLLVSAAVTVRAPVALAASARPVAFGAYVPGADDDPGRIDAFAHQVGRRPVIVLTYKDWRSIPFDRDELGSIWRRGAVPMITWEPRAADGHGFPLGEIAAGRFDRYLRRAAGSARLWGKPLLVRFAHEMNGTWYPWGRGVDGNTARDFRKAWKHVVDLFRFQGATKVRWVWSPNEDSGGSFQFAPLYPGDKWVDWVAMDGFDFGGTIGWPSFTAIFGSTYERMAELSDRPMMIAETAAGEDGGDKAAWIASALGRELPRFPRLRAVVWFDEEVPNADFRVNSSETSARAVRQALASPEYSATRRTLLSTPARLSGESVAPGEPESGYGAPSLLERIRLELREHRAAAALAAVLLALLLVAAVFLFMRRRSQRRLDSARR
jgi:hypothetical protein